MALKKSTEDQQSNLARLILSNTSGCKFSQQCCTVETVYSPHRSTLIDPEIRHVANQEEEVIPQCTVHGSRDINPISAVCRSSQRPYPLTAQDIENILRTIRSYSSDSE